MNNYNNSRYQTFSKYQNLLADAFKYIFTPDGCYHNNYAVPKFYKTASDNDNYSFTNVLGEGGWYQNKDGFTCYNVFKAICSLTDEQCISIMNNYGLYNDHHHTSIKFNYSDYNGWWEQKG